MGSITHKFISAKDNANDDTIVRPTNWNDEHDFSLAKTDVGLSNVQNLDQTNPANIVQDSTHRFMTDAEKAQCISTKVKFTAEGGLAIKLINKTGVTSIKGYCVTTNSALDNSVILVPIGVPNAIGVFYEAGVADGDEAWVVVSGIADVYFWDSTVRGQFARTGIASDTGEVAGQAMSEAVPTSPFATDKHFCEIGHVLETRTGAGLAKVVLHFN